MNERMALLSLAEYKETLERLRRLEKLCARAAQALEGATKMVRTESESALIRELKEAGE